MATQANSVPHPTIVKVDPFVPADQQKGIHNRWHPDIPTFATVKPGQVFKVECMDCTGAQIGNNDNSDDVMNTDLRQVHYLSGPIAVEGAEPGDCLVVDILDVTPFEKMPWGYTGIFERNTGGLFAREFNSKAAKAIWDFHGVYATSRHVPGVRFAGVSHPGLIGTAPSAELLATWNKREGALISEHPNAVPPVAFPPDPNGAYVGQDIDTKVLEKIVNEGARTIPGREHGGNCDPSPIDPLYSQKLIFEGISVDCHGDGKQYNMDATVAFKQAALNAINYLQKVRHPLRVQRASN
ncbi:hypothetical protein E1B28_011709 [Marasmius oreades]|uniref:Formamidase n=1 Tax=Marasmius oreades TaxID=181124 RepID=A0A9P7UPV7_9AGAR|nr:uncharacterized protein E1B28_011709 [Marasmius oreades]KAG7090092.1 hypothetical protein E1B28_011709 [Marasmius oreades]